MVLVSAQILLPILHVASHTGPHLLIRKIEPVNFVLQRLPKSKLFVVQVNNIKKCFGELPVSWVKPEHGPARDTVQSLVSTFCLDVETPKNKYKIIMLLTTRVNRSPRRLVFWDVDL